MYQSDEEWRIAVIMNLVEIRKAIYEVASVLGFVGVAVGFVAVGAAFDKWWGGAFRVGAAAALVLALVVVRVATKFARAAIKDYERVQKLLDKSV
jgi:hypothetical protein